MLRQYTTERNEAVRQKEEMIKEERERERWRSEVNT
jgi:hypothetical protein